MNKVSLIGRLTRDPDIRRTQGENSITVARYTLAVNRRHKKDGQQEADFISCVTFGRNGDFADKYLRKGMKIAVNGRIQTGSYQKQDGTKVYTTDVVVEEHEFCESKGNSSSGAAQAPAVDADGFMDIPDDIDEDLPFC